MKQLLAPTHGPTTEEPSPSRRRPSSAARRPRRVHSGRPAALAVPGFGYLLLFAAYPLYQLVLMSFSDVTNSDVLTGWPRTGLTNYRNTVVDGGFGDAVAHTLFLVVVVVVVGVVGGMIAATSLNRETWAARATLALMVFVWALPAVVVGNLWRFLLSEDGVVNATLQGVHLVSSPVPWLVDSRLALLCLSAVTAWICLPFSTIVLRTALHDVPTDQLEAAELDGAGPFTRFLRVSLHYLRPTVWILAVLLVVNGFRTFDLIYVMTSGGPGTATVTLPFLAYRQAFGGYDYGLGAATAVFSLALVLLLAAAYGIVNRQVDT